MLTLKRAHCYDDFQMCIYTTVEKNVTNLQKVDAVTLKYLWC